MVQLVLPAGVDSATERPSSGRFFDCTGQGLVPALDVGRDFSFRKFRRDRETALRYDCLGHLASQELNRGILIPAIPIAMCRQLRGKLWQVLGRPDYAVAADSRDVSSGWGVAAFHRGPSTNRIAGSRKSSVTRGASSSGCIMKRSWLLTVQPNRGRCPIAKVFTTASVWSHGKSLTP